MIIEEANNLKIRDAKRSADEIVIFMFIGDNGN